MATYVPPNADVPVWTGATASRWLWGQLLYSNGAAAGVHTLAFYLPPTAILLDVAAIGLALWNQGTSASMLAGDAADADGFFVATDMKATELLAGEAIFFRAGTAMAGGRIGAYCANSQWAVGGGSTSGVYRTTARVITFTLTTVGTAATTGSTLCGIEYVLPSGSEPIVAGTYVAT